MKKWMFALLCICCMLGGCNKNEHGKEENPTGTPTQAVTQSQGTVTPSGGQQTVGNGDRILWTTSLGTRTYGREGSFYSESNRIYFLDANTGEADIICDDVTCTHKSRECSACFEGVSYVALDEEKLLVVTNDGGDRIGDMRLYTADVNGSNRKLIAEFTTMMSIYQILFTEDKIIASYWNNVDENMEPIEENYAGIYVFDRKTNTGEVVWSKRALNAIAAKLYYYNNVVFFDLFYYDVTMDEINEYGQRSDYVSNRGKYELCALDLANKSVTVIQDGDWETFSVCGEKLWYSYEKALWSYDIFTGEKKKELDRNLMIEATYGTDRLVARDVEKYHTYYTYTPDGNLIENGTKNNVITSVVYPEITWAMDYNTSTGNGEVICWSTVDFFNTGENVIEIVATITPTPTQTPTIEPTIVPTNVPTQVPTMTPIPTQPLVIPEGTEVVTWILPDQLLDARYYADGAERLNRKLLEEGYDFILEFKTLRGADYRELVVPFIESGEADIVSVGSDMVDGRGGYAQDFIRKGCFEDLSGYLGKR